MTEKIYKHEVDGDGRPVFGGARDDPYYWPPVSFLSVPIPAPLEQWLEHLARNAGHLGDTREDVAVYLIRRGIMELVTRSELSGFEPDPWRYMSKRKATPGRAAGGKARAKKLTPERRREIAKAGATKRWEGNGKDTFR